MPILVIGSLSIDNTLYVPAIPSRGETKIASSALTSFGGKGANQALAAKFAGAQVNFISCVGNDAAGKIYRQHFAENGIDSSSIVTDPDLPTGSAFLSVEESGKNSIIINPGANHALCPRHLDQNIHLFERSDILLLQLEIPFDTIRHACHLARKHQLTILINPSPWSPDFNTDQFPCDVLILNEHEAASLTGHQSLSLTPDLLDQHHLQTIIVTQGSEPTLALTRSQPLLEFSPPTVSPVDTVGAGDAFTGAFAVALLEQQPLPQALRFANAAGTLSITRPGAQGATPNREEIESLLSA